MNRRAVNRRAVTRRAVNRRVARSRQTRPEPSGLPESLLSPGQGSSRPAPPLIDLGVARSLADLPRVTGSIGTDVYMAPEQCDPARAGELV